ncbi:DJ-1/PfpI family protein [Clostridium sp. AL.422]|uniref:DJ-1/PfpI family protein n=1 Tax=Clostridium TaxID=1485 RepID=UPI00293DEBA1|nr:MULTISPECIES: DJ-1/PfpI family protein [unclassified Clostridium]MDV4151677.1 DJ-1/PfpI family protein [Clostridium sp. AL.422]
MGKVLIFIFDGMTDYETTLISHLLCADAGKEIIPISYDDEIVKGRSGFLYKPKKIIDDILDDDIEGLIISGGWFKNIKSEFIELIKKLNSEGKLIGGICGAGTLALAKSGVLNDVKYTTPIVEWNEEYVLRYGEEDPFPRENFILERVVRDKNIITAQGAAFIDFAVEICDWFSLFESEEDKNNFINIIKGI